MADGREAVAMLSPATDEEWHHADVLTSELKAWDLRECEAMGLHSDEILGTFYPEDIAQIRAESRPRADCLLIALHEGSPAGMAGYRTVSADVCELYNVYVRPAFRGHRVASQLVQTLMNNARAAGYRTMRLETATFMRSAHRIYDALGFRVREAYRSVPPRLVPATIWMECALRDL